MDMVLREREHVGQADRLALSSKVADTVEDINKKLMAKEIKIREEVQDRYLQLERVRCRSAHESLWSFQENMFVSLKWI